MLYTYVRVGGSIQLLYKHIFLSANWGENLHLNFIDSDMTKSHLNDLVFKGNEANRCIMLWQTTYYIQLLAQRSKNFSNREETK
jgi:hypothetical protein